MTTPLDTSTPPPTARSADTGPADTGFAGRPRIGRRGLLVGGLLLAGGALAGPGRSLLDVLPFIGDSPSPLVRSSLAAHIGEEFTVTRNDGDDLILTVSAITELPTGSISNPEGQFGVRFRTTRPVDMDSATRELRSAAFGSVQLHLSPTTDPALGATEYEALFNRLPEAVTT